MKKFKIMAVQDRKGWRFATARKDGSLNRSIRHWPTKAAALRAGRREWRVYK